MLAQELLAYHLKDPRKTNRITQNLNSRYRSHSYPILQEEAARIGLDVKGMDAE